MKLFLLILSALLVAAYSLPAIHEEQLVVAVAPETLHSVDGPLNLDEHGNDHPRLPRTFGFRRSYGGYGGGYPGYGGYGGGYPVYGGFGGGYPGGYGGSSSSASSSSSSSSYGFGK